MKVFVLSPPYPSVRLSSLPSLLRTMTVGKTLMPNLSDRASLAFLTSSRCFFWRGKSTSTSTRFFLANSRKASEERTFLRRALQGGHQSEPLKSISTSLFSFLAWAWALGRSVSQSDSSAPARSNAQTAINRSEERRVGKE